MEPRAFSAPFTILLAEEMELPRNPPWYLMLDAGPVEAFDEAGFACVRLPQCDGARR